MLGSGAQTEVQQEAKLQDVPLTSVAMRGWWRLQALCRGEQVRRWIGCTDLLLSTALSNGMQSVRKGVHQRRAIACERLPAKQINSKDYVHSLKRRTL